MGIFDFFKKNKNDEKKRGSKTTNKLRVNSNECEDIGIITHYKGKPLTGTVYQFYENTELLRFEIEMIEGLKNGEWKNYYRNGKLISTRTCENDKVISGKHFKNDGTVIEFPIWFNANINENEGRIVTNSKEIKLSALELSIFEFLVGSMIILESPNPEETAKSVGLSKKPNPEIKKKCIEWFRVENPEVFDFVKNKEVRKILDAINNKELEIKDTNIMGKLKNLEYSKLDSVDNDILRAIDMAYHWFVQENPKIESVCDEKTMSDWYNFIAFSYCKIQSNLIEYVLDDFKKESDDFDFEISPLMEKADNCAGVAWEKYDVDHQNEALDCLREDPELYSGDEDYDADEDPDGLQYEILDDAYEKIYDSVDTSSFKKLSMISF